jgi:hypothetical protein
MSKMPPLADSARLAVNIVLPPLSWIDGTPHLTNSSMMMGVDFVPRHGCVSAASGQLNGDGGAEWGIVR